MQSLRLDCTRTFLIKSDHAYGIVAGKFKISQALIAGTIEGHLLIEFDGAGEFIATRLYPEVDSDPDETFEQVATELGFKEQTIEVQAFFLEKYNIGIHSLSSGLRECAEHPERYIDDERALNHEDLNAWKSAGYFSLYWRQEYFMDSQGNVISS